MPVAKIKASGTPDLMKTEDGIDTIIRQAIGKEPFLSFPRAGDSPVQWIQLLQALDQQELRGWPLLSPPKVQLQKCEKCSREFCSPINYRRHIRVHHRVKKLDKDSTKNRVLLGAYWDKLSVEEAKEVVSFKNVMLEGVPGSSILKALTTLIRKQGFPPLPQCYLRAGAALLDIVQSRPSNFPISSYDLFSILDDASEKTCLCGTAVSIQRYVFDGEAGKIGLEPKNLVACTSFLLEQKLVKAWLADKDAEALRCQKLLMEEEEAAQRRQAEILERKRQKKLRQKEQKSREQRYEDEAEIKGNISDTVEAVAPAEASLDTDDFEAHNPGTIADNAPSHVPSLSSNTDGGVDGETNPDSIAHDSPSHLPSLCANTDGGVDGETQSGYDVGTDQNIERQTAHGHNRRRMFVTRRQGLPKSQWAVANGLHASQNSSISKLGVIQKYGTHHDQKAAAIVNGSKVWSRKPKPVIDGVVLKATLEEEPDQVKNHEVLIGSISVTLGNCSQSEGNVVASQEDCMVQNLAKQNSVQEKPLKPDSVQSSNNRLTIKLWRPVSRQGAKDPFPVQSDMIEADAVSGNGDDQNLSGPSCSSLCNIDGSGIGLTNNFSHPEDTADPGSLRLSSHAAKAFLAQRWKEAISSKHVKLIVSPGSEPLRCQEIQDFELAACQYSNADKCSILASAENRLPATSGVTKSKPRMRPEKGAKIKYIPKPKTATQ